MKFIIASALFVAAFAARGQGAEPPAATSVPDPATIKLLDCHRNYANDNYASKATATEIAEAAMAICQSYLRAAGDSVYRVALEKGFSTTNAENARAQLIDQFKEILPGLTIDAVIKLRRAKAASLPRK